MNKLRTDEVLLVLAWLETHYAQNGRHAFVLAEKAFGACAARYIDNSVEPLTVAMTKVLSSRELDLGLLKLYSEMIKENYK